MKLGVVAIVGGLILLLAKVYFFPWLRGYLDSGANHAEALHRFKLVMLGSGVVVLVLAIYAGQLGLRVLRQGQWPLADSFVVRDTAVKRGRVARARGILFVVLAALLAVDALGLATLPYFLPS
ncbi:MAG: hypothetical protein E6K53_03385 [Gammaproteobacteria bacterium]|nr:MAG: hypothetical protein E6K53_03385 [Gammaproteobacteria bacterium]